ncbi:MAG TPA: hypothetical protein VFV08_05670, partial [Puia sp.]|nr:hypothetical protein [Puia sp.]
MPKEKQQLDLVNAGFTVQRELWERFRELCEYRRECVSDTLHELIRQWVTKVESVNIVLTK